MQKTRKIFRTTICDTLHNMFIYLKKKVLNDIDSVQQILNIEYDNAKCTFTPAKTLNCKKVFSLNKSFKDIYHNDFFSIIPQYKKFA